MKKINPKAQSMLEYALLIITVVAAFIAMNVYVRRAVNARLRDVELEINPTIVIQQTSTSSSQGWQAMIEWFNNYFNGRRR